MSSLWLRHFFFVLVFIPIVDFLWIGWIMRGFYYRQLHHIARIKDGGFDVDFRAAAVVYVLLAVGISTLVLDDAESTFSALCRGALFGLCVYGVYDFTNQSTLRDWSLRMSLADMSWGAIVCAMASVAAKRFV